MSRGVRQRSMNSCLAGFVDTSGGFLGKPAGEERLPMVPRCLSAPPIHKGGCGNRRREAL